jgi:uncharacterized membrane protein YeiH
VVLDKLGVAILPAALAGFLLAFLTRAGAIVFKWTLPAFPGRTPPDPQ